jgi:short subunit dehydrogenase-like uncharacterized protein
MEREQREFDIIVLGATGFTGALVAGYLARRHPRRTDLRWAVAGRSMAKLDLLAQTLATTIAGFDADALARLPCDSTDPGSVAALARRARVIVSTVGPYALYGSALVQACAENGTDYCDLSGELQWIHRMIGEWGPRASASGARLVHCCGFDSVPSDMGVWYLQQQLQARHGDTAASVQGVVTRIRGSFSGGTYASMLNFIAETARDPALRRLALDADALIESSSRVPRRLDEKVAFNDALKQWTAPFIMAVINTRIVHRSNALQGFAWGSDFNYEESMATGSGAGGWLRARGMQLGTGLFLASALSAPGRALLTRLLPAPGEGPDEAARARGCYELKFFGTPRNGAQHEALVATVAADADPGYDSTARMLSECALCLAFDELPTQGGSWTPSSAMGAALLERLQRHAGLGFSIATIPGH